MTKKMRRSSSRRRNAEAGFTLIEIMFVIGIIAILAAIAIPAFTKESAKGKANSEIIAFFAELAAKEENYKVDQDAYLAAAVCPSATSTTPQDISACVGSGKAWGPDIAGTPPTRMLKVQLPTTEAYCRYTIVAGVGSSTGSDNPNGFTFVRPPGNWYYILGECDMDGDGTYALYHTNSVNSTIQKQNEGE